MAELKRYAVYLRKSRADIEAEKLGDEETLAKHKKILTDLAVKKDLYVERIYQEVVSGETIEARPQMQELMKDCYAGKYHGIIVVDVDRLSRGNQGDAQKIIDCLTYSNMNNGVLIITPTKTYDIAHNPDDLEYLEFSLFMSRREYKMINKRMNRGKLQCIVEGEYMGSYRPYGWNITKVGKKRTLTPHETEYEIAKMIYAWKIEGLSPYAIAKKLTMMGVPTYTRSSKEWAKDSVRDILRNPINMGKIRWNDRMQVKVMADGDLKTTRPRTNHTEHYMLYDGIHKDSAMVTEQEWKEANKDFKRDRTKANLKLVNPLASLIFCKNCGRAMHYQTYNTRANTEPRYNHKQAQHCKVKSATASDVISAVAHSLRLYIEDFQLKVNGMPTVNEDAVALQLEALRKELKSTQRKLNKLFDDYEDEVYTANEFVERKAKHNARIESIKEQIAALEDSIPEKEEYEDKIIKLSEALEALEDKSLEASEKNAFLKEIVDRIEFSRETDDEFILDVFIL